MTGRTKVGDLKDICKEAGKSETCRASEVKDLSRPDPYLLTSTATPKNPISTAPLSDKNPIAIVPGSDVMLN